MLEKHAFCLLLVFVGIEARLLAEQPVSSPAKLKKISRAKVTPLKPPQIEF